MCLFTVKLFQLCGIFENLHNKIPENLTLKYNKNAYLLPNLVTIFLFEYQYQT